MAHGGSNTCCVAGAPGPPAIVLMSHDRRITAAGKWLAREPPARRPCPASHPLAAVTARAAVRKATPVRRMLQLCVAVADAIPGARYITLDGQDHGVLNQPDSLCSRWPAHFAP